LTLLKKRERLAKKQLRINPKLFNKKAKKALMREEERITKTPTKAAKRFNEYAQEKMKRSKV
jgi:vacuolar-type H+-ATPase subunit H